MLGRRGLKAQGLVSATMYVESQEERVVDDGHERVTITVGHVCSEGTVTELRDTGIERRRLRPGV